MEVGKLPFNSALLLRGLGKELIESMEFMKELIGWSIKDQGSNGPLKPCGCVMWLG